MPRTITPQQLGAALALRDLSDPAQGPHAMQLAAAAITDALAARWRCPVVVHRAGPVVTVAENYELLGYPPDATTRDARYTRYLDDTHLLRSHTSAMVPAALRLLAGRDEDLVVACPGLVYRRDVVDRLHVGEPHQLDLWRIRRGPRLDRGDLAQMIGLVVSAVLPGSRHRTIAAEHPYTDDGLEVEVLVGDEWVELLECGLAGGHVLRAGGLDPERWSGLALGLGLDRALMLRKGIADIRLLRSDDPWVAEQMLTLDRYQEVSSMPATRRDLSIAVAADVSAEELGDRVRDSLGPAALESVEEVAVVAETPGERLPRQAIDRIGLLPGQKNVLLRLVLRHPTRTLTAAQANRLRDRVYAAVHEGSAHQWAS
jgi:phenylalanyl-tRNA synthetase alpha chain